IVFDYDMAIAEPFNAAGPAPEIDMWPFFAALARKPLLVIRGANSDLLSAEALDKMRSAAAAMKSVVVPGVGHAPDLSEPEAVAAIDEFLGAIEAAA
ncbi:MAG: alpha/beta fold hydrolase, partial [Sphingomicrobium sp.]